ncbi:hypothetical protein F4677DRAFT_435398 [Hypoxylon crocopeplum]|nr:hypothetical protein F4677DRAFT_435398 [Hypoxylon crocopeplum]
MRLVSTALRDVKPTRFVLHPLFRLPLRFSQLCARDAWPSAREYGKHFQRCYFSATSLSKSEDPIDILLSRVSDNAPVIRRVPAKEQKQKQKLFLIQETKLFGKWRSLLTEPFRLAVESDFDRRGPAKEWRSQLLVDKFENRTDLALWSCLLDYQKRINGDVGVQNVWKGLWGRKSLYDVQSPLAPVFWQTILEAAMRSSDSKFLTTVWIYSEWMYNLHGVKWPQLYSTVLSHFLRTHQHHQALQWQLRLTPNFYPGAEKFATIMKQFAHDSELYHTPTLESLYIMNPDHQLYDIIVPHLYNLGASEVARKWRRICSRHDDLPQAPVPVRSFLRFVQGYFPHEPLHPEESAAAGDSDFELTEDAKQVDISREFVNRVHGGTFGISVKKYNDRLGAKWLASSWVGLDIAISTISALGIEQIGPLSLQSIALREGTSEGLLNRIEQLREQSISIIESNYLRLVLHLAKIKDEELLSDLLNCDLHPDVFDDSELQARLVVSTAKSEEWRTHRLVLATRLLVMRESTRDVANTLARIYILHKDRNGLLRLLHDMKTMEITLYDTQTGLLFDNLVNEAKSTLLPPESLYFYLSIYQQLMSMEVPVPVRCWRKILFCLARQGRIDDLEKACVELVDTFTSPRSSRPGFVPVHPEDIPEPMKKPLSGVKNLLGVYVPSDLPTQTPLHPLRQIFDNKMLGTIVRCSFHSLLNRESRVTPALRIHHQHPREFYAGRVVRLIRRLRDRGLFVDRERLATYVKLRLVTLYGPGYPTKRTWQVIRARNTLSLAEMKSLLDEAWGEDFLPPTEELREQIETRGQKIAVRNWKYLQEMGKTTPQLRVVL